MHRPPEARGPRAWHGSGPWNGPADGNARHQWGDARIALWQENLIAQPSPRLPSWARLVIPVVFSLFVQLPATLFWLVAARPATPLVCLTLALALLGPLALLGARRFPRTVVTVALLAGCLDLLITEPSIGPPYVALSFAIFGAIVRGARLYTWIVVGIGWTATVALGILLQLAWSPSRIAITTLGILIVFGIGEAVRTRRENVEKIRSTVLHRRQSEVQAERVRIARELHDVLAHSLSQINVQAGVGLHLMQKQPEQAAAALASIKETSKTALDEVRSVLGVLRAEDGQDPSAPLVPEPDLSRLPGLVASVTSQGVQVSLDNGVRDAPKAVQLAIYRIVQESLTNVVRHAHATRAEVRVAADDGTWLVVVDDNGRGLDATAIPLGGRGLLGMRERAELLGGHLETGRSPLGGVRVTARIPQEHE